MHLRSKTESPGTCQFEIQINVQWGRFPVRLLVLIKDDRYVGWESLVALNVGMKDERNNCINYV